MTQGILDWLDTYDNINEIGETHVEELTENVKNIALQRTGKTTIKKWLNGGRYELQFMLWLKNYSESDAQKIQSLGILDDFSEWAGVQCKKGNVPYLGDNKSVYNITTTNILLMTKNQDGTIGDYGIQLYIDYSEKEE
jgi:hypothetical protein